MFNKDKFHNQLALNLGFERLLNDKRYEIKAIDVDGVISVCIMWQGKQIIIKEPEIACEPLPKETTPEIEEIRNAVHQAYLDSQKLF